jgi:uncharacterized protein
MNALRYSIVRGWRTIQTGSIVIAMVILSLVVIAPHAIATGVYDLPRVAPGSSPWVIDQGEVLSRITQGSLSRQLETLAQQTGAETRFVTIRWLDYGETAETFADQLFTQWFPTPEDQDRQAVLVLDTKTNTIALHAGPGLAEQLPAAIADSIAKETALYPIQRGNNYNQGLLDAGDRLRAVLSGEPDPGPPKIEVTEVESTFKSAEETNRTSATVIVVIVLVIACIVPMATYYWYQGQG